MSGNGELYNTTRANRSNTTEALYTVSLKAGGKLDAPWVIVKADTPGQLLDALEGLERFGILYKVAGTGVTLRNHWEDQC